MISTIEMRLFLDRNPNALDAVPQFKAGVRLEPGLYWSPSAREVMVVQQPATAPSDVARVHRKPDATFEDLIHTVAIGGGGRQGDPVPIPGLRHERSAASAQPAGDVVASSPDR